LDGKSEVNPFRDTICTLSLRACGGARALAGKLAHFKANRPPVCYCSFPDCFYFFAGWM
jgi:hypothetical protein